VAVLPGSTTEHAFSNLNPYVESLSYSRLVQVVAKRAHRAAQLGSPTLSQRREGSR